MQVEKVKAGAEHVTGSREEQDELELPNLHKQKRGGGMPLLGQVSLPDCSHALLLFNCGPCEGPVNMSSRGMSIVNWLCLSPATGTILLSLELSNLHRHAGVAECPCLVRLSQVRSMIATI